MSRNDRTLVHDERGVRGDYDAGERAELAQCAKERGYEVGGHVEVMWRRKFRPGVVQSVSVWRGYTTSVTVRMEGVRAPYATSSDRVRLPADVVEAAAAKVRSELAARLPGVAVEVSAYDVVIRVPRGAGIRARSLPSRVADRSVRVERVAAKGAVP